MQVYRKRRKKLMGEINVVPYIDVMLVLLVIFMITTPLLTEGVKVDLVQAEARNIQSKENEPFVVTINDKGEYFVNEHKEAVSLQQIGAKAGAVFKLRPKTDFLVRGDREVAYDAVIQAMVILQGVGVPSVGLVTDPTK